MSFWGNFAKIVSIGLFVASIPATGGLGTGLLIGAYATGVLGSLLDKPKIPEQRQQIGMTVDPNAPVPVVYGRAKVGSIVADWFIDPDTDAKILYEIVALCHGSRDGFGIGGIDEMWINGRLAVVNPTAGNLAESGGNDVREHPYVLPCLDYQIFPGDILQNVGNQDLSGLFSAAGTKSPSDVTDSDWSATTDTGKGIAAVSLRCANLLTYVVAGGGNDKAKQPTFSGPPAVTAIVRGNFVEDPRAAINAYGQPVTPASVQFTNVGAADTITVTGGPGVFTWQAGDRVVIDGSASNDGVATVASVGAGVLTLSAVDSLTNEGPTAGISLYRWAAPDNGGDNPALCIRDYLLSPIYGFGLDPSWIDEASFRTIADHCDVLIDYPLTAGVEQATRYTCNGVVDTSKTLRENLDALESSCRCKVVWEQGVAKLVMRNDGNLIENSTFEADIAGTEPADGAATLVHSTAQAHSGTGSCKVTTVNTTYSGIRMARVRFATEPYEDGWGLSVGFPYTSTAYVYAAGGTIGKTLELRFHWTDGLGGAVGTDATSSVVLASGWNAMEVTGTVPLTCVSAELAITTGAAAQGVFDFYVDDWTMQPDPVLALTPANILGQWSFRNAGNGDKWNLVTASYVDPLNGEFKAAQTQWPPIGSNSYLTADNDFLNRLDLSLPFTNDQAMAQMTAQIILNESRNGLTCRVLCTEAALAASVGDLVTVTHDTPGWDVKPFWVTAMELFPDTSVGLSLMEYQPDAYALDTMEDRRTYAATSHEPIDDTPGDSTIGYARFKGLTTGDDWDLSARTYAVPTGLGADYETIAHLTRHDLPQGVHLAGISAWAYGGDAAGGTYVFALSLEAAPLDGTSGTTLGSVPGALGATNTWIITEDTCDHYVDWTTYHYYFYAILRATGTIQNMRFMWAGVQFDTVLNGDAPR